MLLLKKSAFAAALIFAIAASLLTPSIFAKASHGTTINKIVAVVNDEVITQTQLNQMLKSLPAQVQMTSKQVLKSLINQTLQLQIAKKAGISVSTDELNQAIQNIADHNHTTVSTLKTQLAQHGMNFETYKKQMHKQLLLNKIQQQALAGKVSITDNQVRDFIKSHQTSNHAAMNYQYVDMLFPTNKTITTKMALMHANSVLRKEKASKKLSTAGLPKHYQASITNYSAWQNTNNIPDMFLSQLAHLKKGAISKPIVAGNGVHLLQLTAKQTPDLSFNDAKKMLFEQKATKAVESWINQVRKNSYIKIM